MSKRNPLQLELIEPVADPASPVKPLVWGQDDVVAAEKFQLLIHRLNRIRTKKPIQTVLITSSIPAEGKSTIALNLSGVLAHNGSRTLLIDADLRRPQKHKPLASESEGSLGAVLRGDVTFDTAVQRVDPYPLYYLSAGECVKNPVPLFESASFQDMLTHARKGFDWVIIDSPPLNPLADAHCMASVCDATILVVRWGYTPKRELDQALTSLRGLPLVGMVINTFDEKQDKYYYSYYKQPRVLRAKPSIAALLDPPGR